MSLLPLFSQEVADEARNGSDAADWIAAMRERNLLFQSYGEGHYWYRLHDLLIDFGDCELMLLRNCRDGYGHCRRRSRLTLPCYRK